jgi:hypothetical protein
MLDTGDPTLIFMAVAVSFHSGHGDVRAGSRPDRGSIHAAAALQRRLDRLSARLDIAGGPAPFVSTYLFSTYKSAIPIGIYVCVCAAISICAALPLPDQTRTSPTR